MAKTQLNTDSSDTKPFSLIPDEKLLAIYAAMLKCRLLEQRATELFQHGQLESDFHASSGREAIAAAAGTDLQEGDILCMAPGDWLPALVKGCSPAMLFRVLSGSHSHVAAEIESDLKDILIPAAKPDYQKRVLAKARSLARANKGEIVAVFLSDTPQQFAGWRSTIRTSGTEKLPIVFVHYCDTRDQAISRESKSPLRTPAALHEGVPTISVDALDPVAIYRVAYEAIARARQLRGSTLIECLFEPSGKLSNPADQANGPALASLTAMENYLRSRKIQAHATTREIISAFQRDLDSATQLLQPKSKQ